MSDSSTPNDTSCDEKLVVAVFEMIVSMKADQLFKFCTQSQIRNCVTLFLLLKNDM